MADVCFCSTENEKSSKPVAPCEQSSSRTRRRMMDEGGIDVLPIRFASSEVCKRQKVELILRSKHVDDDNSCSVFPLEVDDCPGFGITTVIGRRRKMEDAVAVHPAFYVSAEKIPAKFHYFGVYDGHGCSHVARCCRERLHVLVKEELQEQNYENVQWKDVMEKSFFNMDNEVVEEKNGAKCLQTPKCDAGSTAVVSVVTPEKIVVANCGDSRAVMCRGGKTKALSVDHKPDRPDELRRIQEAGGRVIFWDGPRVLGEQGGVLAMSRAIGDGFLKPYVSSEPEVTIIERTAEDECMILASDGLWDVVSNEIACGIARMCLKSSQGKVGETERDKACADAAMLLTKLALARNSADNVSVIVVDLRR